MKLFVFGSTGDLFKRKVIHALKQIKDLEIYALGRKEMKTEEYISQVYSDAPEDLKKRIKYLQIHFSQNGIICHDCPNFYSKGEINHFYVALPPDKILEILKYLNSVKNQGYKIKALVEKPFGSNLKEATELKAFIEEKKLVENIYLADHYLFKEHILTKKEKTNYKKIILKSLEEVGLEGRDYYDSVGALKDMIQSHFLNILIKMFGKEEMKKIEIIDVEKKQYKNYEKELGKLSKTETYVKILLKIGEKIIELETGKKFDKKESLISIDDKKYNLNEGKDAYLEMFEKFFLEQNHLFPTMEEAILTWELTEEMEKKAKELTRY